MKSSRRFVASFTGYCDIVVRLTITTMLQLSLVFHPRHYFLLESKRRVLELVTAMPGFYDGKVATAYLQVLVQLSITSINECSPPRGVWSTPGSCCPWRPWWRPATRSCGPTSATTPPPRSTGSQRCHESRMSRSTHNNDNPQRQYVEGAISRSELVSSMEEVGRHLELVTRVWGGYRWDNLMVSVHCTALCRPRSDEWTQAQLAASLMAKVDQDYLHRGNRGRE